MKHKDNYYILFHRKDEDFEPIAITNNLNKDFVHTIIAHLFDDWCYEESEENMEYLNEIVDSILNNHYYEDDCDTFQIKNAPYYE